MALESSVLLQHERYQIMEQLGEGGMGTVYLAADRNLPGRTVAIKENSVTSADAQTQFQREAVILARLSHPNLPAVTDHFVEPSGCQYLVMDYVTGDDLQRLTLKQRGFIPESTALNWIGQICDALSYMHTWTDQQTGTRTPVLHRDIKPSNIKCTPEGHVVLVDFGLAKFQSSAGTSVGARAYTPGYAPIEQYTGGTDVRSDVYALGATFYSIVTGKKPPPAPSLATDTKLVPPRQINSDISANTEAVILRAMSISPSERYQTVEEMKMALIAPARYADEAVTVPLTHYSSLQVLPPTSSSSPASSHPSTSSRSSTSPQSATGSPSNQSLSIGAILTIISLLVGGSAVLWYLFGSPLGQLIPANAEDGKSAASAIVEPQAIEPQAIETQAIEPQAVDAITLTNTATTAPIASVPLTPVEINETATVTSALALSSSISDTLTALPPQQANAKSQWTNIKDEAIYLFIPSGEFTMGDDESGSDDSIADEGPDHIIWLDDFWIMQTEVTNQQYQRCVDDGDCTTPSNNFWPEPEFADYPVTNVSWEQAVTYATWVGGRLPTEAEWEKSARGDDGRIYPWGDEQPTGQLLNYRFEVRAPVAVGQYTDGKSPYEVLDMAGNVEEWVQDWYAQNYYAEAPSENPQGPDDGVMRVVRGGSFNSNPLDVRSTARGKAIPTSAFEGVGFRVVVDAVE